MSEQEEYITDAMAMLGAGYREPERVAPNTPKGKKPMNKPNKSHLLINENPLQVLPSLAIALGLEEAIALQQVHYWLNNAKNEGRVDDEGNKWVYNTYAQWKEDNFPFWSEDKIQRTFLSLEKKGVLISKQLDAKSRDMTKFYRIDYDALCAMHSLKSASSNVSKLHDVNMNQRLPETTTETKEKEPKKKDLVDAMIDMAQMPGVKKAVRLDAIASMIKVRFGIEPTRRTWIDFMNYADKRQQEYGESLPAFFDWLESQKGFDVSYWPPAKMQENWARAFMEKTSVINDASIVW